MNEPYVISARSAVDIMVLDQGDTIAIEFEEASGTAVSVLLPARAAGEFAVQLDAALVKAARSRGVPRES